MWNESGWKQNCITITKDVETCWRESQEKHYTVLFLKLNAFNKSIKGKERQRIRWQN